MEYRNRLSVTDRTTKFNGQ